MEHNQRELRRLAARAFLESLDQLQAALEASENQAIDLQLQQHEVVSQDSQPVSKANLVSRSHQPLSPKAPLGNKPAATKHQSRPRLASNKFTFQDLEMAVADIEQYMGHHQANVTGAQPNWEG